MKTIRINTHTFIDVYAEDEYLMVRYDNNPNLDKKIPFAYVIGYHFYKADKNSRGELFIQNKKERDIKVTFAPSFNEDASKIEPVLAGILENRKSKSSSANNKPLAKSDQVNTTALTGVSQNTALQKVTFNGSHGTITCYEKYFESFLDTVYYANIKKTEWIKLTDNYCLSLTLTNGTVVSVYFNDLSEGNRFVDYLIDHSNLQRTKGKIKDYSKEPKWPMILVSCGVFAFLIAFYTNTTFMYLSAMVIAGILFLGWVFGS